MSKGLRDFSEGKNGQETHEERLNIISCQKKANQNHKWDTMRMGYHFKKQSDEQNVLTRVQRNWNPCTLLVGV